MATYRQTFEVRYNNAALQERAKVAAFKAAVDILNDGQAPSSRREWAEVFLNTQTGFQDILNALILNAQVVDRHLDQGQVTDEEMDSDVQFVVNSYINAKYV